MNAALAQAGDCAARGPKCLTPDWVTHGGPIDHLRVDSLQQNPSGVLKSTSEIVTTTIAVGSAVVTGGAGLGAKIGDRFSDSVNSQVQPSRNTISHVVERTEAVALDTSSDVRKHIESNIAESRGARESSKFEIHLAKTDQVKWNYLPDEWELTSLKAGDQVLGGLPGQSTFYTTFRTLESAGSSREDFFKSLQVSPHPEFGYRPKVGIYEVQQDLPRVPNGTVRANTELGPGGGDQFWIRDYQKNLKLVDEITLGQ